MKCSGLQAIVTSGISHGRKVRDAVRQWSFVLGLTQVLMVQLNFERFVADAT